MHPKRHVVYTGEKVDMGGQLSRLIGHAKDIVFPFIVAILFACGGVVRDAEYGADITLRAAFPAGGAEQFAHRLTELSAGGLEMVPAGEEFLPGSREEAR